jgi:hypothetical protein
MESYSFVWRALWSEDESAPFQIRGYFYVIIFVIIKGKEGKTFPVIDREGPEGCETFRFPHFLDSRLTDGGKVVSLKPRSHLTPRKIPDTHFC